MVGLDTNVVLRYLLQDDPKLASTRPVPPASVSAPRNTMPRDNPDFTGRGVELDRISGWLDDSVARSLLVTNSLGYISSMYPPAYRGHIRRNR